MTLRDIQRHDNGTAIQTSHIMALAVVSKRPVTCSCWIERGGICLATDPVQSADAQCRRLNVVDDERENLPDVGMLEADITQ